MKKKYVGINRDKLQLFQESKLNAIKKKNRFKVAGKEQDQTLAQPSTTNGLLTNTTQHSSNQEHEQQTNKALQVYDLAMQKLNHVDDLKKQIIQQCKLRITSFKESDTKRYDQNICELSKTAVSHLLQAEKSLVSIRNIKGTTQLQQKYYRNMEKSLAQEIRQKSRELRAQEKEHYQRVISYQKKSKNSAIELSETQKQKMRGEFDFEEYEESSTAGLIEIQQNRDTQITQLVKSINKLSSIYKQLNELVIMQGSIIDRIDINIEETLTHVQEGNKHLHSADQHASNSCAQKCMMVLLALIMILAVILGIKYSKE